MRTKPRKSKRQAPRDRRHGGRPKSERSTAAPRTEKRARVREEKKKRPAAEDGFLARRPIEPDVEKPGEFHAGYVALVGRPNVGKSTILNQLLGQKIAATTHKPQTTRKNLLGILHPKGAQILFLDTPGYHQAEGPLNRYMVQQAKSAIAEADVVGYVVEARDEGAITPGNEQLIRTLAKAGKAVVLLVNKIDRLKDKTPLLRQIERYKEALGESMVAAVPISALKKNGLEAAVREIAAALPLGTALFEADEVTDQPERAIVGELIREKVVLETQQELPYATAVTIDAFEDDRPRIVRIAATIHVERDSQKGIVIGRRGERLKAIGTRARKEIEHFVGAKVFLDLNVRVTTSWSTSSRAMEMLGYVHQPRGA